MEYSLGLYEKAIPVGFSFPKMFDITREGGFDRLEISIDETDWRLARLDWSPEKQRELAVLARAAGTPIRTMCLSGHRKYPLGSHDPEIRRRSMEIMRKAIEFSVNAGISLIQLAGYDVYYEEGDEDTVKWFVDGLKESADYASRWAQSGRSIPCYGTTHADYYYGEVPCLRCLTEEVAKMAFRTELINPKVQPAPQELQDKRYYRKHGANAYYGQGGAR
jgi:hypothetical protein